MIHQVNRACSIEFMLVISPEVIVNHTIHMNIRWQRDYGDDISTL